MIPESFGRYRIQERLGEGGMGSVWKAEDTLLHRVVALKFLSAELVDSPEARQRFLREARSASVLEHPGIATVFDAGEVEGIPYLAVQLVEGVTLSERIRQGPIPVPEAVEIHRQASEALAHAHSRKVLHRDISSRNLMLKSDGSVVLVDFGLAKRSDMTQLTRTGTTQGTIAYLAPEVLEGSPATEASDRYSLGVVLYEMLTGELPFRGERVEAVMLKIMTEDPEPPSAIRSDVPPEVDRVVLQLLAKDPEVRGEGESDGPAASGSRPHRMIHKVEPVPTQPTTPGWWRVGRWPIVWLFVALLAGTTASVIWFRSTTRLYRPRSIAVLPITNLSANPDESDYIATSLADFLSVRLSDIDGLRVIPLMSSRHLGDSPDPVYAARRLNVESLITGTLRVENARLRFKLTLVDGKNGRAVWSQEFTSPVSQVQETESSAILALLDRIHEPLSEEKRRQVARATSQSPSAYELYRQGVQGLGTNTREGNEEALALFSRAIALDTAWADPYSGLGAVLINRTFFEWGNGSEQLIQARRSFEKAISLDSTSISARRGLVQVLQEMGDAPEGEMLRIGRELLALNPTSLEHRLAAGSILFWTGLEKAAVQLLKEVLVDDPNNVEARWFLVIALAWDGQADECIRVCNEYEELEGEDPELLMWKSQAMAAKGDVEQAIAIMERSVDLFEEGRKTTAALYLGYLQQRLGRADEARQSATFALSQTAPRLVSYPDNSWTRLTHASAQAFLGMAVEYDSTLTTKELLIGAAAAHPRNEKVVMGLEAKGEDELCRCASNGCGTGGWIPWAAFYPAILERPKVKECVKRLFEQQHARSDAFLREFNIAGS